jgi:hypothetical protein
MAAKPEELSGLELRTGNLQHIDRMKNDTHKISSRVTWWVTLWWTVYLGFMTCFLLLGMKFVFN